METPLRSLVKAVTWQLLGLVTMTALARLMTGSWTTAGGFALAAALVSLCVFVVHERVWNHISWGKTLNRDGGSGDLEHLH